MAAESGTSVQALFKDLYVGTKVQNRVPEELLVQNLIEWDGTNRPGDDYTVPVLLRRPYGGTRETGSTALTDFSLRSPTASTTAQATLKPSSYVGRGQLPMVTGWRTSNNPKGAFQSDTELIVEAHKASAHFEKEIDLIYGGGAGLGTIESVTSASGTTLVVVISAATWAPGIWAQYEGASFDAYESTVTTKQNTNAEIVLSSVDPDTRSLTFTTHASDVTLVLATHVLVPVASVGKSMTGLIKIITNATTLFGIASTNLAWKGNAYAVGGALTMGKLGNACLRSSTRTMVGNWKVLVSPFTWQDLSNDSMSLRRFVEDTKSEVSYGTQKLSFVGAGGSMEIMPYPLIKAGEAIAFRSEHFKRIGSTQFEFKTVDESADPRYLSMVADKAAYEFRYGWDEALFCDWPGANVHLTGIVNASLS